MKDEVKLTNQELKVIDFLTLRNHQDVHWEELAQFSKDPKSVKLKTIQKVISDLKKKYVHFGIPFPFKGAFSSMTKLVVTGEVVKQKTFEKQEQTLVQIKRTPGGNVIKADSDEANKPMAHIDFVLDFNTKRVKTRSGGHLLNDNEWYMMKYFHANVGRIIKISELRDKVVYQNYGSKLPPRWFDSIGRTVNNLRKQVPELSTRLLTVKGAETSYLFQ